MQCGTKIALITHTYTGVYVLCRLSLSPSLSECVCPLEVQGRLSGEVRRAETTSSSEAAAKEEEVKTAAPPVLQRIPYTALPSCLQTRMPTQDLWREDVARAERVPPLFSHPTI